MAGILEENVPKLMVTDLACGALVWQHGPETIYDVAFGMLHMIEAGPFSFEVIGVCNVTRVLRIRLTEPNPPCRVTFRDPPPSPGHRAED